MSAKLFSVVALALAVFSASASPLDNAMTPAYAPATVEARSPGTSLVKRSDFLFRFYSNGGCDHNSAAKDTWPANGSNPGEGNLNTCYSAPTGVDWNRVEVNVYFGSNQAYGVQTFCNINCAGGASIKQQNSNCYLPIANCAIGSFRIIT